jgi:hypothetical protein
MRASSLVSSTVRPRMREAGVVVIQSLSAERIRASSRARAPRVSSTSVADRWRYGRTEVFSRSGRVGSSRSAGVSVVASFLLMAWTYSRRTCGRGDTPSLMCLSTESLLFPTAAAIALQLQPH